MKTNHFSTQALSADKPDTGFGLVAVLSVFVWLTIAVLAMCAMTSAFGGALK